MNATPRQLQALRQVWRLELLGNRRSFGALGKALGIGRVGAFELVRTLRRKGAVPPGAMALTDKGIAAVSRPGRFPVLGEVN